MQALAKALGAATLASFGLWVLLHEVNIIGEYRRHVVASIWSRNR